CEVASTGTDGTARPMVRMAAAHEKILRMSILPSVRLNITPELIHQSCPAQQIESETCGCRLGEFYSLV
ncbi:hypothetical protein, partial [Kitasatospora sp. NPDC054795]